MQGDGNLVLYHTQNAPGGQTAPGVGVWATGTVNKGSPPYRAYMDPKGAFKIIDGSKGEIWSSGTSDTHGTGRERLMWAAGWDGDLRLRSVFVFFLHSLSLSPCLPVLGSFFVFGLSLSLSLSWSLLPYVSCWQGW